MSMTHENQKNVSIKEIRYYFDGVERDRLDSGRAGTKLAHVLRLRDQLLLLPEGDFEKAIETIDKLITAVVESARAKEKHGKGSALGASELFDRVQKTASVGKTSAPPTVAAVK